MTEETRNNNHQDGGEHFGAAALAQQTRIQIRNDAHHAEVRFLLGRYEQHLQEAGGDLTERSRFEAEGKVLALRDLLLTLGAHPSDLDDLASYHGYEPLPEM